MSASNLQNISAAMTVHNGEILQVSTRYGSLQVDPDRQTISMGEPVRITESEMRALLLLLQVPYSPRSFRDLFIRSKNASKAVYYSTWQDSKSLRVCVRALIKRVRAALRKCHENLDTHIRSVEGVGYMWEK